MVMRRPSRQLNIFSISSLDLFASAMGAFIIILVITDASAHQLGNAYQLADPIQ